VFDEDEPEREERRRVIEDDAEVRSIYVGRLWEGFCRRRTPRCLKWTNLLVWRFGSLFERRGRRREKERKHRQSNDVYLSNSAKNAYILNDIHSFIHSFLEH
jgi:hypothetical protein